MKLVYRTTAPITSISWYRPHVAIEALARAGHDVLVEHDDLTAEEREGQPSRTIRHRVHTVRSMPFPASHGGDFDIYSSRVTHASDADVILWNGLNHCAHLRLWRKARNAIDAGRIPGRLVLHLDDDVLTKRSRDHMLDLHDESGISRELRTRWLDNLDEMMRLSDAVIATTPILRGVAERSGHCADVRAVDNYLPASWWELPPWEHRPGPMTVGYTGTHGDQNFAQAGPWIGEFLTKHSDVDLYVRGNIDSASWNRLPADRRRLAKWLNDPLASHKAMQFDVAIIPLAQTAMNESRTALKFLEYSMRGIPTIASAVGPYPAAIDHGRTGFLVREPLDWRTYLEELRDPERRREIGAAAREWSRGMTMEGNLWRWEQALARDRPAEPAPAAAAA